MAEEDDAVSPRRTGDAAAVGLAMNADPSVAADAGAYLREQTRFARLQSENLVEQNAFELSHLRWRRFNDRARGVGHVLLTLAGFALVAIVGAAIWSAAHDRGLIVESFTVPPDLATQGETGAVVAAHVMDRISAMESHTSSFRAKSSYQNNWGNDIKVQIPETGISVTEVYRFLVGWLGDQTHISGEVVRTAKGYAVTARVGATGGETFEGSDLDPLLDKAAEHIMDSTQPYLYAVWLSSSGRTDEGYRRLQALAESGAPASERAWAYAGLAAIVPDDRLAIRDGREGIRLKPDIALAWSNIAARERVLGKDQMALEDRKTAVGLLNGRAGADVSPQLLVSIRLASGADLDVWHGDFRGAAELEYQALDNSDRSYRRSQVLSALSLDLARDHDLRAAREIGRTDFSFAAPTGRVIGGTEGIVWQRIMTQAAIAFDLEDWRGAEKTNSAIVKDAPNLQIFAIQPNAVLACAHARSGDTACAEALIGRSPPDCYLCLRTRGRIRGVERKWDAAAYWFAMALEQGPSMPFAETDWGAMLMAKGDFNGAIAKFKLANDKGPQFPDPLEMWGEALIAKNRSDLALAKFTEADKYAPNWGRLHLKWGEALLWSGDKAGSPKQFAAASQLDLSPSEKTELSRVRASHG
jgi:tetratricopeptide (TPR) repeat protein